MNALLRKYHREMWLWLAETGKNKNDWPGWAREDVQSIRDNNSYIDNFWCFACACREYLDTDDGEIDPDCHMVCPIEWIPEQRMNKEWSDGYSKPCECIDSLYAQWTMLDDKYEVERKKELARLIAEAWPEEQYE